MTTKLEERIKAREQRLAELKARQDGTRRKILVGAILLARVDQGRFSEAELRKWLDEALTRKDDRALFGLDTIEPAPKPARSRAGSVS
jgi:hypothetical protein